MAPEVREPELGDDPTRLEISELRAEHRTVIVASGEIDAGTVGTLRDAVEAAVEPGSVDVWFDLSDVESMDPSGVNVLVDARATLRGKHKRFAVICPAGPVSRTLRATAGDAALAIYPDRTAAHAAG
jgi:anti-sigma B factor antagonist